MESKPLSQRPVRWFLWPSVPLITAALYALTTVISGVSYNLAEQVASPLMRFDPDQAFLVISIHHVFQAIAAFLLIALLALVLRKKVPDFGFNKNELRFSIRSVLLFCGVWFVIQFALSYLLTRSGVVDASFAYPLTARNFIGNFLFEVLLSGTSEEILFRAMTIPLMVLVFRTFMKKETTANIVAIACATLIFMLAHINFNLHPFAITHFNLAQQITCLIFGAFYGWLMVKTKSVVGPMLAHNLLNGVITLCSLLISLIF